MHLHNLAQFSLERILIDNYLESSIRVWPHHFDTGIFTTHNNGSGISISAGLAIPATYLVESETVRFFQEAIDIYKSMR